MGLPTPKGLNVAQKGEYANLLKSKAQGYLGKSREISSHLEDLWNKQTYTKTLKADYESGTSVARDIIAREAAFLQKYAPASFQSVLQKLSLGTVKSPKELSVAGSRLKASPFSATQLQQYKAIASYHGASAKVAYATQRLQQIREEDR